MKNLKFYIFALLALPILSTSCKKDDDNEEEQPPQQTCKTSKAYVYDTNTGGIEDSVIYTYTGTQITKLEVAGQGNINLEYTNNQVTKRSYFDATNPTTASDYQTFTSARSITMNIQGRVLRNGEPLHSLIAVANSIKQQ
jgi:hypothetical protein